MDQDLRRFENTEQSGQGPSRGTSTPSEAQVSPLPGFRRRGEDPPPLPKMAFPWPRVSWGLIAVALGLLALGPLLLPGYFWGAHDARSHVYFLFEWDRAVQEGIWWPRWAPDFCFGYGYPFFNIYGPFATMIGEAFHLLGADFVTAVKMVFGLASVGSTLSMYGFGRRLWGPKGGLLASLVYTYAPYHIFDTYVRAALPESVSLALLPLVFWGFYESVDRPRLGTVLWAAGAFAALMLTSNAITLMFAPVLGLYLVGLVMARCRGRAESSLRPALARLAGRFWRTNLRVPLRTSLPPLAGLLLGFGLSASFWLPAAAEFRYVRTDQWYAGRYDYRDHFIYPFQLLGPYWGFGTSIPGPDDQVSFQMGIVPTALGCIGLALALRQRKWHRGQALFFATVVAGATFLMTSLSAPLWEALSPVRFAQFPWRYQVLVVPALAVLAGSVLSSSSESSEVNADLRELPATLLLALLVLVGSYPYLQAEIREPAEGPVSLAGLMRFQQGADEMTGATVWTSQIPRWSPMADLYIAGLPVTTLVDYSASLSDKLAVHSLEMSSVHEKVFVWAADDQQEVVFLRFYYPGWTATLLDEQSGQVLSRHLPIRTVGSQGKMAVPVPAGRHILLLRFEDTPIRQVGKALAAFSVVVILGLVSGRLWMRRGGAR
jgi:hypothetical protein